MSGRQPRATRSRRTPSPSWTILLPNFNEKFITNSYQPFAEYEWHPNLKLTVTGGAKFSRYTFDLTAVSPITEAPSVRFRQDRPPSITTRRSIPYCLRRT